PAAEQALRLRRERPRLGAVTLALGDAALVERPARKGREDERGQDEHRDDAEVAAADGALALRLGLLLAAPLGSLPPGERRLGQDVVEELVPRAVLGRRRRHRAEDAAALGCAERVEHRGHLRRWPLRPAGEVGDGLGDLRLAAADEELEAVGGR